MRLTTSRVALLATLLIAYNLLWDPLAHSVPAQATPRVAPAVQLLNATHAAPPTQHLEFDLGALLHNPLSAPTEAEQRTQTLQCPNYAGPMFFPYHPGAKNVPRFEFVHDNSMLPFKPFASVSLSSGDDRANTLR